MYHYYYRTETSWSYFHPSRTATSRRSAAPEPSILERIQRMASENAVVIFSMSTCCMSHAVKRLFCGLGVNPMVHEIDLDPNYGKELERALARLLGGSAVVPVVFIGGKLVGAVDRVIASHISGDLVPLLKDAGALWL